MSHNAKVELSYTVSEEIEQMIHEEAKKHVAELFKDGSWFLGRIADKIACDFDWRISDDRNNDFRKEVLAVLVNKLNDENLKMRIIDSLIRAR